MSEQSYYDILEVSEDASQDEIKKSYKKLAKKYHPDISKEPNAETKMKNITMAFDTLKSEEKRRQYDLERNQTQHSAGGWGDLFSQMFGGFQSHDNPFSRRSNFDQGVKASAIKIPLELDIREIFSGATKKIKYKRNELCSKCQGKGHEGSSLESESCPTCHGSGTHTQMRQVQGMMLHQTITCPTCSGIGEKIKNKCNKCNGKKIESKKVEVKIKVEPGFQEQGDILKPNMGNQGSDKKFGPLVVRIFTKKDEIFLRHFGNNVVAHLKIPVHKAITGGKITIPSLHGPIETDIKSGINIDDNFPIKGKGLPSKLDKKGNVIKYGDMFVNIIGFEMPKEIDEKTIESLKDITLDKYEKYSKLIE